MGVLSKWFAKWAKEDTDRKAISPKERAKRKKKRKQAHKQKMKHRKQ